MTDNEIIKALECLQKENSSPDDRHKCYFMWKKETCFNCHHTVAKEALDLINRLKAENEQKAKKLQEILPIVAELKSEAIKEFAERLKEELVVTQFECGDYLYDVYDVNETLDTIDKIKTEMVGENDDT